MSNVRYRADIDGLRALAVLPVVAHHMLLLPGGFVGVDIFFVISGYLISQIIFRETADGTFSLVRFYERRIRRILPALLLTVIGVLLLALIFLAPPDTQAVGESALAATLSVANFYFWQNTGYFEVGSVAMPLLHSWSLGVEEQFYIFFPLIAILIARFGATVRLAVLVSIFTLSLTASVFEIRYHPSAAFYLLHSRAWELALGSILAALAVAPPANRVFREALAAAGLIAVGGAVLLYTPSTPFPGVAAVLPCLGAAAILWAGAKPTMVGRLLSLPPVRFIGLISYSLYLVHWPVIVFQRTNWLFYAGPSRILEKSAVLIVCFALAILSWRFVERPFRRAQASAAAPARPVLIGCVATAVVAIFAFAIAASKGVPWLLPDRSGAYSRFLQYDSKRVLRVGTCMVDEKQALDQVSCLATSASKPNVLILGDSHAADLWSGMSRAFPEVNFLQATGSSCVPSDGPRPDHYPNCKTALAAGLELARSSAVHTVVIGTHWARFGYADAIPLAKKLEKQGVRVIFAGPGPQYDRPLPRLLELSERLNDPDTPSRFLVEGAFKLDRELDAVAAKAGIEYLSRLQIVCPDEKCRTVVGHVPMLFDADHFTVTGSTYVANSWRQQGLSFARDPGLAPR